jgi:hypothetical protein
MLLDAEIKEVAESLSPALKHHYEFLLRHLGRDPKDLWPRWAAAHRVSSDDETARRRYDQQRHRLREHFRTHRA